MLSSSSSITFIEFASGTLRLAEQLEKYVGSATREASRAAASGSNMNITGSDMHLSDSSLPVGDPSIALDGESGAHVYRIDYLTWHRIDFQYLPCHASGNCSLCD